ncbi:MAG: putative oxidoreductase [Gaiellaceae bacterium]|jgi:putative oxidoreductase|nr:putative oxidoreductase [Gaiellaceae bacterium]
MAYGLLFLRLVVGLVFFAHGAQKLFGWWGGPGLEGTKGWLGSMGFRMPGPMALMVAMSEAGGLLFAAGFLTPLAALLLASSMLVAIGSVHWRQGFWNTNQGYEFNLVLLAVPVAIAATGPGRFSVDHALKWDDNLSGPIWGVGVFALAIAGALFVLTVMRAPRSAAPVA